MIRIIIVTLLIAITTISLPAAVNIISRSYNSANELTVNFTITDNANSIQTGFTQSQLGVVISDNEISQIITDFRTSVRSAERSAVAFCFDHSISSRTIDVNDFHLAKTVSQQIISYLSADDVVISLLSLRSITSIDAV